MRNLFRAPAKEKEWRSVNDLESSVRLKKNQKGKLELRESVQIAVIDDQPFEPATNLRNNHYNITHINDLQNINEIKGYAIILCDLQGVGAQLHGSLQGAHLIKEIKTHYPEKIVIAYTGGARTSAMARTAQQFADKFLKKDDDLDEWIGSLDDAIDKVADPVYMWKEFRKRLLDFGVTPFQLTKLEDAFVSGYEAGGDGANDNVQQAADGIGLTQDVRAVVQSFVASAIFKILVG